MSQLSDLEKEILQALIDNPSMGRGTVVKQYNIPESRAKEIVKKCKTIINENDFKDISEAYDILLAHSSTLEKQKQRLRDQQRIERKIRNDYRVENALSDFTSALADIFEDRKVNYSFPEIEVTEDCVGIFQLSDAHFNELININGNIYDFNVAAKRLQKFVHIARKQFKNFGITQVIVAMTGDMLNSDRRIDELLNMSTNRAKASALGAILLEQVIVDLAQDFVVTVTHVTGNESRAGEHIGSTEIMISDNYDVTIFEMLRMMFKGTPIKFIDGSVSEKIIQVKDKHILLIHGHQMSGSLSRQSQQIKGKYSDLGIKVDYILFGHIHECLIADFYARSSSLCGANAYSNHKLQLTSRASQNIHFVSEDGINSMKVDLQEYDNFEGYDIDESLEAYNAKSASKQKDDKFIIVNVF
jgi:predicted phosphodiesterase